jgi:hypothetical protein
MVQEKDAAKKRQAARDAHALKVLADLEKNTVAFRWSVIETKPAYRDSDEYDDYWVPAKSVVVSPYFETEKEAKDWLALHEPDPGKTLSVKRERKIRRVTYTWL